ncbi:MAG: lipopolysaccharide assembly protein LapA domain-containing protein [Gemmatimonadota bacterium]|nr:lipopolysaccharide assembly protein LapA domain-containing protein [Gemmatimonadota bacterium]
MRIARRLFVLALFAGLFWFAWRFTHGNPRPVSVDLVLGTTPALPLWAVLLLAFGLGALCAGASLVYELVRRSLLARRYRKAVAGLESEIHQLRNLPLGEGEEERARASSAGAASGSGRSR